MLGLVATEKTLRLRVTSYKGDVFLRAPRKFEVIKCQFVYRKDCDSGSVLGRHVADRCTICNAEVTKSSSEKLYKLVDDTTFAQHLGYSQDQVSCG
jgi:uncharacterized protein with PIN domain